MNDLYGDLEEDLRKWFGRKGAPGKKKGWVDCNTCRKDKKTGKKKCSACGRSSGEKRSKYPSCRPTPSACGKRGNWGKKSKAGKKGGKSKKNEELQNMELYELVEEELLSFIGESYTEKHEKELEKIADELAGASKMHKGQSDRIKKILDQTDDEELKEEEVAEGMNCGCGQDPCETYGKNNEKLVIMVKEELESVLDEGLFDFLKSDQTKDREEIIRQGENIIQPFYNSRRGLHPRIGKNMAMDASMFLSKKILPFKQKYPEDTQFQNFYAKYISSIQKARYETDKIKKDWGNPEENMRDQAAFAAKVAARDREVAAGQQRAQQRAAGELDTGVLRGRQRRAAQQAKQDANRRRQQKAQLARQRAFRAGLIDYSDTLEEIVKEELEAVLSEKRKKKKKKKKGGKKDACYNKVKSRYKVWPSAYASGALVKCRKVGAANWGNSKKEQLQAMVEDKLSTLLEFEEESLEEKKSSKCTKVTKKASSTRKGKKWMKCVKSDSGGYKRIHWGQAGVRVTGKSGNTKRKKSFKARHGCKGAKSNTPKGQACKDWAE